VVERAVSFLVLLALLTPAGAARAEGPGQEGEAGFSTAFSLASKGEPLHIQADALEFDYEAKQAVYRGAVVVTQGDTVIKCDRLTVAYDESGEGQRQLKEVVAVGGVAVRQGAREAQGDRAVFNEQERTVTLTGNAVLREGRNRIEGETVVVYLNEGRSRVDGGRKRVKAVLYVDGNEEKPAP